MSTPTAQPPVASEPSNGSGTKRTLLLIFGSLAVLVALALLAGGGAAVWGLSKRDSSGYFTTGSHHLATSSYALASDSLDIGPHAPGWFDDFARVRIQASSGRPVFIGIGRASDVRRYLARVHHAQITDFDTDPFRVTAHSVPGTATPALPRSQRFWRVQASGPGMQTISWPLEKGTWSAVAMNADGSRNVYIAIRIGARVTALRWIAIGFLAGGVILLVAGAGLIYIGARKEPAHVDEARRA
jgi:hypothetical protein